MKDHFLNLRGNSESTLSHLEAAIYLGITPELLLFYTSTSFKKKQGITRRLNTSTVGGVTRYLKEELDNFDNFLKEPWAEKGEKRPDIPQKILSYLHAESGGKCVRCGSGIAVETAHIEAWSKSHSHHHHNLIRICSACHSEHDIHQSLSTEELRNLKDICIKNIRIQLKHHLNISESNIPTSDSLFFGYQKEILDLNTALLDKRFILIKGPGGIGKTQLIIQTFKNLKIERPILWINVEHYSNTNEIQAALEIAIRSHEGMIPNCDYQEYLDNINACLVLDGIEQLQGTALDDIDDWIYSLQIKTTNTQILITSQVDLQRTHFDYQINLKGIKYKSSKKILSNMVRVGVSVDETYQDKFIQYGDGHPLTLRLSASLINYFGSGKTAWEQIIRQKGVEHIKLQKRSSLNKSTSLEICLSLSYEALNEEEKYVLFLVSNAPGGLFRHWIESTALKDNTIISIAGVQRWSLIYIKDKGETCERLYVISPIAKYTISRWKTDLPIKALLLEKEIATYFTYLAQVIDSNSIKIDDKSYKFSRYAQELPNFLHVLKLSENTHDDTELSSFTTTVCQALMSYFFVLRLGDIGSRVMLQGARIALRDKDYKRTSSLLSQMIGLIHRGENRKEVDTILSLLDQIDQSEIDPEVLGNIALIHAMYAHLRNDFQALQRHAQTAITYFETASVQNIKDLDIDNKLNEADLSASFNLLGDALLAQNAYNESITAYRKALSFLSGGALEINYGQLHHQIANCESNLGNHKAAADYYIIAAEHFQNIGMREYLSNALGELGNTILDINDSEYLPISIDANLIKDGIDDLFADFTRILSNYPFNPYTFAVVTRRKLFGFVVVSTLYNQIDILKIFSNQLREDILDPALDAIDRLLDESGWWDELGEDALKYLDSVLKLIDAIFIFEQKIKYQGLSRDNVNELINACRCQSLIADQEQVYRKWLSLYLCHRWNHFIRKDDAL